MIIQILDSRDRIAYMSGLHPADADAGLTVLDVIGQPVWPYIYQGAEQYRAAFSRCRAGEGPQVCDVSIGFAGNVHRWIGKVDCFGQDQLVITVESVPVNLEDLSARESEVLTLLSQRLSSTKIAEKMGITVSTVEKHRSKIRSTLRLKNECALTQLASCLNGKAQLFFSSSTNGHAHLESH
ncbi:MAG: helix-turn-helix transcriptional regulator [Pirellulales bacterium]|nr:helix-turn-helix transcriptional regulator [Pirellulales bacterium]